MTLRTSVLIAALVLIAGGVVGLFVHSHGNATDNAWVWAARSDLAVYQQALEMYYIDWGCYPEELEIGDALVDPQGQPYATLNSHNFRYTRGHGWEFHYEHHPTVPGWTITVGCHNKSRTILIATPDGITR